MECIWFGLDSDLGGYIKSPVDDIPEWRRPGGGGALLQPSTRRKPYEDEPVGNAFSSSYPPRPAMSWNDTNSPSRPSFDRPGPGPNGPPGRWDRLGDRDRERGRLPHDWDGDEPGTFLLLCLVGMMSMWLQVLFDGMSVTLTTSRWKQLIDNMFTCSMWMGVGNLEQIC